LADPVAVCIRCGSAKDLPLGRCPACAHLPVGQERELSLICSTRVLDPAALVQAQLRIQAGEPLQPSAELLARARAVFAGAAPAPVTLSRGQLVALALADVLLTPMIGYAVWFRYRTRPGPAARQVLRVTLPISALLFVVVIGWRLAVIWQLSKQ
jgi:hypothetical protein